MFGKTPKKKTTSYRRNFKNFKINEFVEELYKIDLINITANGTNINESFDIFFNTIEGLLITMAPRRKQTKNEKRLEQRPWITKGLLKSMQIRDSLYKELSNGNPETKKNISIRHKYYRNLIVTLLRRSKENYYKNYFDKNKNNVKKTWDGIRNILAVSKKNTINIDQLNCKNRQLSSNSDKANALNDFFTNIGPLIEKKVPKAKNDFKFYLKIQIQIKWNWYYVMRLK